MEEAQLRDLEEARLRNIAALLSELRAAVFSGCLSCSDERHRKFKDSVLRSVETFKTNYNMEVPGKPLQQDFNCKCKQEILIIAEVHNTQESGQGSVAQRQLIEEVRPVIVEATQVTQRNEKLATSKRVLKDVEEVSKIKRKKIENANVEVPQKLKPTETTDQDSPGPRLACSLLSPAEKDTVKQFTERMNWGFHEFYSPEVTHVIADVDKYNQADWSVKYMNALAAGKWIVSINWIKECVKQNRRCDETPYEVLDKTGKNGPHRSRVSTRRLFTGITFYLEPPFTTMDRKTLEALLITSGGRVVQSIREVSVSEPKDAALTIIDSECKVVHTNIALQHNVVPVHYEWVLGCLSAYNLHSVDYFLLCPATLIPFDTLNWPKQIVEPDSLSLNP